MSSLQEQLADLRARVAAIQNRDRTANPSQQPQPQPNKGSIEDWTEGAEVRTDHGAHFESKRIWKNHQRHGNVYISDLQDLPHNLLDAISDGLIPKVDPRKIGFLDTETTGLAGGSGTYAFLIGVGGLTDDGFELKQYFLRDYSEEKSQLAALTEHLRQYDVLCTYNGRAYDQPLLETRYRMSRMAPPFGRMEHLDLLYGARRLYRLQMDSCRLVHLESEILGFQRIDDVPGSMIPYLYFEFLRTKSAHRMWGIFEHNAFDILTLACLTGIIPRAFHAPLEVPLRRGAEMVGLARWLRNADRTEEAITLMRRALQTGLNDTLTFRTLWDCAQLEKKRANESGALELWTELTTAPNPHRSGAYEELAKYYERRERNYALALDMTEEALRLDPEVESLHKRRERLRKKLSAKPRARLLL